VNVILAAAGAMAGLGVFLTISQLMPGKARLDAAVARVHSSAARGRRPAVIGLNFGGVPALALRLPMPSADLDLLGKDPGQWVLNKIICGLTGLCAIPALATALAISGVRLAWTAPAIASLALGAGTFFVPDLLTRASAREKRAEFRHALTSYLDLVALERGAGAGPTQALEAAAQIGGGWAFARIAASLVAARNAGRPPWQGLAALAGRTGVPELADLAEIAEVADHEGARILQTLAARAESMRREALAATRAKAGSRSTTMVIPIALLGVGFLLLLIFPIVYRTFG
jgi:pilus assembly protein TadC